jgi:hypothetical protein
MPEKTGQLAGPAIMILSALVFGYFGFFRTWNTRGAGGEFVLFPALLGWTLKISSILFLVAAGLTIVKLVAGNLIYALTGVAGAGMFVVVAVMDIADQGHTIMPYAPVVLVLFAAWNGYGSWLSLRVVLAGHTPATIGDGRAEP